MKASILTPLRHRPYRRLFSAQVFSDMGNWFDFIALEALIIYHWGLGAGALAAFAFCTGLPWALVSPLLSVWVDRLPKKALMIGCNLMRIPLIVGFIFTPNLFILLPIVFLKEVLDVGFDPVRQATMRFILPKELLYQANALSQLSLQGSKILAPTLGAIVVAAYSPQVAFVIEAVGFAISTLFLLGLPSLKVEKRSPSSEKGGYWRELKEGFQYFANPPILRFAIVMVTTGMFMIWLVDKLIILWSKDVGFGISQFGYITSSIGAGSVIGALAVSRWSNRIQNPLLLMSFAGIGAGVLDLVIGSGGIGFFIFPLVAWMGVWFFIGFVAPFFSIPYAFILQTETPPDLLGRVTGTANAFQNSTMLIAPFLGASLAKGISVGGVFITSGFGLVLASLLAILIIKKKNLLPKSPTQEEQQVSI